MTCQKCGRCCRNIYLPPVWGSTRPNMLPEFESLLVIYSQQENSEVIIPGNEQPTTLWRAFCRNYRPDVGCIDYENRPGICQRFTCTGSNYRDEVDVPETLQEALRMRRQWLERTDVERQGRQGDAQGAGAVDGPRPDPCEAPGASGDGEA